MLCEEDVGVDSLGKKPIDADAIIKLCPQMKPATARHVAKVHGKYI